MRVLIYGKFSIGRLGSSYRRAFEALGHEVVGFDFCRRKEFLPQWVQMRGVRRLCTHNLQLRRWVSQSWNAEFLDSVERIDPDFVFVIAGDFLVPETIRQIRTSGISVALFFPDDPLPGSSNHLPEYLPLAEEASTTFIWSRRIQDRLRQKGLGEVAYLPFAWDPHLHPFRGVHADERSKSVVFIGGWDSWREKWLYPVAENFELKIWGPEYWRSRCNAASVRNCWQGRAIYGREVAHLYREAAVSLNILRRQNLPDGTNMRTFEIPGAGGTMLSSKSEGVTEIFPAGEAALYFDTKEELLTAIRRLLTAPQRRASLSRTASDITRARHRYVNRAVTIVNTLSG